MSTAPAIPPCLSHLTVWHGIPVPWIAAWSSEGRVVVRYDPLAGAVALFNRGRQGRGRPVFGVMSPERQRAAVISGRCQLCGRHLDDLTDQPDGYTAATGWLPNHPGLVESTDQDGTPYLLEPPCHRGCAEWAAVGCPGIRRKVTDLIEILEIHPVAQLLDLSDPTTRLRRAALRHPHGVVGLVRYSISKSVRHDP